jgi:hypothetical protein
VFRFFKLLIAGYHPWSRCWMGFHRWSRPGGHCEKCGKCDTFFGPHPHCTGKTCLHYRPLPRNPYEGR